MWHITSLVERKVSPQARAGTTMPVSVILPHTRTTRSRVVKADANTTPKDSEFVILRMSFRKIRITCSQLAICPWMGEVCQCKKLKMLAVSGTLIVLISLFLFMLVVSTTWLLEGDTAKLPALLYILKVIVVRWSWLQFSLEANSRHLSV